MKLRLPINFSSAILGALTYITFACIAYGQYRLPFSPRRNWLSDLGNQIDNPQGASFYNAGVILTSFFLAIWFLAGLSQWRLKDKVVHKRLLAISKTSGVLATCALTMSALYPINLPQVHSFWSQLHFMMFGIGFGFSVTALRYHPRFSHGLMVLGAGASVLPFLMFVFDKAFWLEWLAVGLFMAYILTIGIVTLTFSSLRDTSLACNYMINVKSNPQMKRENRNV